MAKGENFYETFDSAGGPIQKGQGDSDHRDKNLRAENDEGQDKEQGLPAVPMK